MGSSQIKYAKFHSQQEEGSTGLLRNNLLKNGEDPLTWQTSGQILCLKDLFERNAEEFPEDPFIGTREYKIGENNQRIYGQYSWLTFEETASLAKKVTAFLNANELCPREVETGCQRSPTPLRVLGLFSKNRAEWAITDAAACYGNITTVPLYDTIGKEYLTHIIQDTQLATIAISADNISSIVSMKQQNQIPNVKTLICYDTVDPALLEKVQSVGLTLIKWQDIIDKDYNELVAECKSKNLPHTNDVALKPESIYTICYTSSTTGVPKGALISNQNIISNARANEGNDAQFKISKDQDVYISYLPLAHALERSLWVMCVYSKIRIGFYHGDLLKLTDDLIELKPTIMASVPRLLNRFDDLILRKISQLDGNLKATAEQGLETKVEAVKKDGTYTNYMYDSAIFNKFKALLGGRVRLIISGAAPLHPDVQNRLMVSFCCPLIQGYGQTESSGVITIGLQGDNMTGHVGGPLRNVEVKLIDVPELKYFTNNTNEEGEPLPQGEICFRGQNAFQGYFKNVQETEAAFDKDGFIHTGDIGQVHVNGSIKIIDRVKHIFKLSHGEYICPTRLEEIYQVDKHIDQVFVYGDSFQNSLVAIVVPNRQTVIDWAEESKVQTQDFQALLQEQSVKDKFVGIFKDLAKKHGLFGFEVPQKVHLSAEEFTSANEMLTWTMKLNRTVIREKFTAQIEEMYKA